MLSLPLTLAWLGAAGLPGPAEAVNNLAAGAGLTLALGREAAGLLATPAPEAEARFAAAERLVTNWRGETLRALSPLPVAALAAGLRADRPVVTRCVKLNNYWCIKRAGWNGEVGFDDEGHVGFASAERGADAAVTLLRRYYLEFGRRSALDIVRRWAPAGGCYAAGAPYRGAALAVNGLGNTLRGRYLASRGRPIGGRVRAAAAPAPAVRPPARPAAGAGAPAAAKPAPKLASRPAPSPAPRSRVSAVPLRPLPTIRVPDIAAGMGERPVASISAALLAPRRAAPARPALAERPRAASQRLVAAQRPAAPPRAALPQRVAAAVPRASAAPAPPPRPATPEAAAPAVQAQPVRVAAAPPMACGSEETRIRNYAARIVDGLGVGPADDLALFEPDGRPKPNLTRVLLAMSGFELGYLRASAALVAGAVERQAARAVALNTAAAPPAATAGPAPVETP